MIETRPLRASACFAILAKQNDFQMLIAEIAKEHDLPGEGWQLNPSTRTATRDVPDAPTDAPAAAAPGAEGHDNVGTATV